MGSDAFVALIEDILYKLKDIKSDLIVATKLLKKDDILLEVNNQVTKLSEIINNLDGTK